MTIQKDFSLKNYNTFRININAKEFVEINSITDLKELITEGHLKDNNFYILGGGSNTLFTKDFDGIVIKINLQGKELKEDNDNYSIYEVSAGEDWDKTVEFFVNKNLGGLENLSYIPGEVGASPVQNIGAYGAEAKDTIEYVNAINLETAHEERFSNPQCKFAYRDSIFKNEFKNKYIVTSVAFKLTKNPELNTSYAEVEKELEALKNAGQQITIKEIRNAVIQIRTRKLPDVKEVGTAGSFFKNPIVTVEKYNELKNKFPEIPNYPYTETTVKIPAGWLIEKQGWKGWMSEGNRFGIYPKHALIPVNYDESSGDEILSLTTNIQKSVKEKFNIDLIPEVNVV